MQVFSLRIISLIFNKKLLTHTNYYDHDAVIPLHINYKKHFNKSFVLSLLAPKHISVISFKSHQTLNIFLFCDLKNRSDIPYFVIPEIF